jgi:uncharacterized membrane protein YbhN (UPF0104 family)
VVFLGLGVKLKPIQVAKFGARTLVTGLIAYWLFLQIDPETVAAEMARVHEGAIVGIVALILACTIVPQAWRWRLIVRGLHAHLRLLPAIRMVFLSMFVNQVVPGSVSGDVSRVWLGRSEGIAIRALIGSVILDRLAGLTAILLLCVAGLPILHIIAGDDSFFWAALGLVVVGTSAVVLFFSLPLMPQWLRDIRFVADVVAYSRSAGSLGRRPGMVGAILSLSLLPHVAAITSAAVLANQLEVSLGFAGAAAILPPILLAAMLPISFAGWGVREGAMVLGLALVGVPSATAIAISVLWGTTNLIVGIVGGLGWLLIRPQPLGLAVAAEMKDETESIGGEAP